jgi:hypothetical protein
MVRIHYLSRDGLLPSNRSVLVHDILLLFRSGPVLQMVRGCMYKRCHCDCARPILPRIGVVMV